MIRINDIARVVPSLQVQVRRFGLVDDYNHCRRVEGIDDDVMVLASLELEGNSKLVATNVRDAARHKAISHSSPLERPAPLMVMTATTDWKGSALPHLCGK